MLENDKIMQDKMAEMQEFVSKYKDSPNPALDMMKDTFRRSIENKVPDGCEVATKMSDDGATISFDLVQTNPDSSKKPWINRDLDECIDSCE